VKETLQCLITGGSNSLLLLFFGSQQGYTTNECCFKSEVPEEGDQKLIQGNNFLRLILEKQCSFQCS